MLRPTRATAASGGIALAELDKLSQTATVRWLARGGDSYHSSWSPDGKRVIFNWKLRGENQFLLYVVDAVAGERRNC